MKTLILLGLLISSVCYGGLPKAKHHKKNHYFATQTLGYFKLGHLFDVTIACAVTNPNIQAWSNTRRSSQIAVGDVIYSNSGGTVVWAGGSNWWIYSPTNGGPVYRVVKIDNSGVVTQISNCAGGTEAFAYQSTTHTSNCANTNYTEALWAAKDDKTMYVGKQIFNSSGGFPSTGNFVAARTLNGAPFWTFSIATAPTISAVGCCQTNPVAEAGADAYYSLPSPTVLLNGVADDCDGIIVSYLWARISGPSTPTINNPTSANANITTGLVVGTYVFSFTATDDLGNSTSDNISITIVDAFVGTPAKIQMKHYYVWSFAAEYLRGADGWFGDTSNAALATAGHKNGAWLGEAVGNVEGDEDPINGNFDHNALLAGIQTDNTFTQIQRDFTTTYYLGGNGFQRCLLIILPRKYDMYSVWWRDVGGVNLNNVAELIWGSLEDIRKGLFEFDTNKAFGAPTITYTFNQVSTNGWYHFDFLRGQGQYILIRMNDVAGTGIAHSGPGISEYIFNGKPSDDGEVDTRILPWYYQTVVPTLPKDTTMDRGKSSGYVFASGVAKTVIRDTIWKAPKTTGVKPRTFTWEGGYVLNFASSGDPLRGVMDRQLTRPNRGEIKVNLNPYNICTSCPGGLWKDSTEYIDPLVKNYTVFVQPNRRVLEATGFQSREYVPIDSIGADKRMDSSYDMFSETFVKIRMKIGSEQPHMDQGFAAMTTDDDYESDDFPGRYAWGRVTAFIPGNEMNVGFRNGNIANSNYMDPFSLRAFHDKLYREQHKVFDGPCYSMGLAAWKIRPFYAAQMLNNIIYMDMDHPLCDVLNVHVVVESDMILIHEPGVTDALGARAMFGGWRNEGMKGQTALDTFRMMLKGRIIKIAFSEVAMSTNQHYLTRQDPGGSDASVSTHGARPIYSSVDGHLLQVYESQGYEQVNIWTHQDGVEGLVFRTHYEWDDAADTVACSTGVACGTCPVGQFCDDDGTCKFVCINNSDANDGQHNRFGGHTHHGGIPHFPFYKGSYFITQFDQMEKYGYRVVWKRSDSTDGQLHYLYRNIIDRNKYLSYVQWQDSTKPAGDRIIPLWPDVTTCTNLMPSMYDWNFPGIADVNTVVGGNLTMRPKPEGNYIEFSSVGLSAFLDNPPPANLKPMRLNNINKTKGLFSIP